MANIKIDRKTFEKEIGKLDEKMQERIALFGCPVESLTDEELELEIFPNRPDLLSYQGFKRGFLGFLGRKVGLKEYKLNKPEKNYEVKIESSVKGVRPFTFCAIIKGLNLNDEKIKEIIEVQEKLHNTIGRKRKKLAIGIYPLENIQLPITYKALEPDKIKFKPLESPKEMSGLEILQRHPTGRDYAHLLAGKTMFPIFMDNNNKILSMPPIINSEETGRVTTKTKDIFIECSGFDSFILEKCLNILVTTFGEMGGKIYQMKVGGKITPSLACEKMKISLEKTNKLLGLDLKEKDLRINLEKMGHKYEKDFVHIPSWRTDILHEVDLIEDVGIGFGYENLKPEIPQIATTGKENPKEIIKRKLSEILIGLGMLEVSNYHLTKRIDQFTKMGIPEKQEGEFIKLESSKTEYDLLRKDLTHYLMKIISENVDSEYPHKLFEMGRVFELKEGGEIAEKEMLACSYTPGNFTEVKQVLDYLGTNLGLDFEIKEFEKGCTHFIEGRGAEIYLGEKKVGQIGEIHPKILKNWKIKMPVSLFEIELEKVFKNFI